MTLITFCQQCPALTLLARTPQIKTCLLKRIVVLVTRVNGPSYAVQFENKTSGIKVAMT